MGTSYDTNNIRALLIDGFTDEDLRNMCYDTPDFRPVYDALSSSTGKSDIVARLIEHTE